VRLALPQVGPFVVSKMNVRPYCNRAHDTHTRGTPSLVSTKSMRRLCDLVAAGLLDSSQPVESVG